MAYLIFINNGEEYDRREIAGRLVIGRAADCNVNIHDILLSRHHCKLEIRLEEGQERWLIQDLHSKNGTFLRGNKIEQHLLEEGDELRIGRTRVMFKAGAFIAGSKSRRRAVERPVDPSEALAGTVTGMVVCEPGEALVHEGMPSPKPRPADSAAYKSDDVYGMISEIISNSWDSVMAQNSQPVRMQRVIPAAAMTKAGRGPARPQARVSFALQAAHREEPARAEFVPPPMPVRRALSRRRRWVYASATIAATVAFIIALVVVTMGTGPHEASGANALPQAQPALTPAKIESAPPMEAPDAAVDLNLAAV